MKMTNPIRSHVKVVMILLVAFTVFRLKFTNLPAPRHFTTLSVYYPCSEGRDYNSSINDGKNESLISTSKSDGTTSSGGNTTKFLTYQIIKGYPFNGTHVEDYRSCEDPDRAELNEAFKKPGVLDFHTDIHTNLDILYIGSSVAMQLSQGFQEATHSAKREVVRYAMRNIRFDWKGMHENTHISQTVDGGTVGALRLTGLFEEKGRDYVHDVAPRQGGGWFSSDAREMKRMVHTWKELNSLVGYAPSNSTCEVEVKNDELVQNGTSESITTCDQKNFDVLVYQIPVEWMSSEKQVLPSEYLERAVNLCFDEFGINTLILQTIPISKSLPNVSTAITTNENIWKYAKKFNGESINREETETRSQSTMKSSQKKILVMDVFSYSVAIFLENTIANGMIPVWFGRTLIRDLSQADDYQTYLNLTKKIDKILKSHHGGELSGDIFKNGYVCADNTCETYSRISYDGLHWCMKETSGRMNAGLACLIKCSLKELQEEDFYDCERYCNRQYMSLKPLSWEDAVKVTVEGQR